MNGVVEAIRGIYDELIELRKKNNELELRVLKLEMLLKVAKDEA